MKSKFAKTIELGKKFLNDYEAQMGGVSTLYAVFFGAIIILAIVIVFTFVPGIGSSVEQATPRAPAYWINSSNQAEGTNPGGSWNATDTNNPNQAALAGSSGAALWSSTSGMLKVTIIIGLIVIILGALFGIFQARKAQGGGPM